MQQSEIKLSLAKIHISKAFPVNLKSELGLFAGSYATHELLQPYDIYYYILTVDICYEEGVKYTADTKNLCWFWECVESFADGGLRIQLLPRRCALGSRMPWG